MIMAVAMNPTKMKTAVRMTLAITFVKRLSSLEIGLSMAFLSSHCGASWIKSK
jgi:Na+-transporting NADH:ubiquinone oxidoreductase subunit NqrD